MCRCIDLLENSCTQGGRGYGTTNRPAAIGNWFRIDRRKLTKSPEMPPEEEYAESWWKWWTGIQPDWRIRDEDGARPSTDGEPGPWDDLERPGNNGMLVILLSLMWWHEIATEATFNDWTEAIRDVVWVLALMVAETKPTGHSK